jgi:DNA-binding transcriptional regulator YdaS (Cro superfamily)
MGEKSTIKERAKRNLLGELVAKLGAWCAEKRGRQTELARLTGATPQTVNDWLTGRKKMNCEQALRADAFMRKVERARVREKPTSPERAILKENSIQRGASQCSGETQVSRASP